MTKLQQQEFANIAMAMSRDPRLRAIAETAYVPGGPVLILKPEFIELMLMNEEYPNLFEGVDLLELYDGYLEYLETKSLTAVLAPVAEDPQLLNPVTRRYKAALSVLLGEHQ